MGCCGSDPPIKNNQALIPEAIINRLYDSIARIEFKINGQEKISTGFFIKLNVFE